MWWWKMEEVDYNTQSFLISSSNSPAPSSMEIERIKFPSGLFLQVAGCFQLGCGWSSYVEF
jgi:hypothetical protein